MIEVVDQTGYTVRLPQRPDRIVSVVPSQTELLSELGLDEQIAGITKFCIHPDHIFRNKERIGGTKALKLDNIRALKPDVIIANKEENLKEEILALREEFPVFTSDICDLDTSLEMIRKVGQLTGTTERSEDVITGIQAGFNKMRSELASLKDKSCLYMIWKGPWMCAGKGTFIDDILDRCHLSNVVEQTRYPELTEEDIVRLAPEVIILSSEPFPFKESHISYFNDILPTTRTIVADGEMFSWYGSRLLIASGYLTDLRKDLL
jgi:ABC-type Fe3+-hydroxamate transport system substrate-binding protein